MALHVLYTLVLACSDYSCVHTKLKEVKECVEKTEVNVTKMSRDPIATATDACLKKVMTPVEKKPEDKAQ